MSSMTNMSCMGMAAVAEIAEHDGGKQEKQPEQETADKKQGKWISCHSFAPSAARQLSDNGGQYFQECR
jgi:hypothetical protein